MSIVPSKILKGDEFRVIAPSKGMNIIDKQVQIIAINRLSNMGYNVTFSKNIYQYDKDYNCASIEQRVYDLHNAFSDNNVKGILTVIGGYNVNQILKYIDYELIKRNPKFICGFSDITALLNAIYTKTGLITFYGPHFSSFGMLNGFEYTERYFKKAIESKSYKVLPSDTYSDDIWYKNQYKRCYLKNEGFKAINYGKATGIILGGNLCTFNLLQGTEYMPIADKVILFLEDDAESGNNFLNEFDRNLESLIQTNFFENVCGIVIGRTQLESKMDDNKWRKMLLNKKELKNIPIVINADFGHTTPIFTFPIGGRCKLNVSLKNIEIEIMLGSDLLG